MTPDELRERMLEFSNIVIQFTDNLTSFSGRHMGRQLVRSATSIGANYEEAQAAESKADFIHKLQIALKESRESHYWLSLLFVRLREPILNNLLNECTQIRAILGKAVFTAKSRP